jgi:hypothetical protein
VAVFSFVLGAIFASAAGAQQPGPSPAAVGRPDRKPVLQVPLTDSRPVIDGKLEEPCWKHAAATGSLQVTVGATPKSVTEAFLLRDADHLYVGLRCVGKEAGKARGKAGEFSRELDFAELLISPGGDRNSFCQIRITPENGGKVTSSYHEHEPPWCDRSWQPQFKSAAVGAPNAWTAEFALPFDIFAKNKTLASEIGFCIRRAGMPGQQARG